MDAFKELVARSPDMKLATIDELHGMVFWAGAATKWAQLQISLAEQVGGLQAQVEAWRRDGIAAAELDFSATQRLGTIANKEPRGDTRPKRHIPPGDVDVPKWQRLGFKDKKTMVEAEFLATHPKEAKEVIEQAKAADDFPSRTAVKNRVRAKKAEERLAEAKERAEQKQETATDKAIADNKRFVAEYFKFLKDSVREVEEAIIGAGKGKFDPASKNFVMAKHDNLIDLFRKLEELI